MSEPFASYTWEPESVDCAIALVGTGASAPTRSPNSRANYTITRTGTGVIKLSFQDDPGPTFQGIGGFCFGDPTATNVLGWTVCTGTYTARSGNTQASLTFTIGNGSNAAADLPATSTLALTLNFKQAPGVE
jgi:hypothetical protein